MQRLIGLLMAAIWFTGLVVIVRWLDRTAYILLSDHGKYIGPVGTFLLGALIAVIIVLYIEVGYGTETTSRYAINC
jgi:hypothetical protein